MEYKPPSDTLSLKNLRMARSLSQNEVAEAIGTNANTVSRWERGIATPSPYYRRKLAEYFGVDPQELFSDLNGETDKTAVGLPPEPEAVEDLPNETEDASQGDHKTPPAWRRGPSLPPKIPRWIYIPVASIIIFMLVLGGVFVLPSLLHKPLPDLFPPLCSGNFQSANTPANTSIVPTPTTSTSPDGELIGLSEGATIFDLYRPNQQEVQYKLQAAQDWVNNPQAVVSSLNNAISSDQTDAEAQIYLENWRVLGSNHPHITFVVGVNFLSPSPEASRSVLQGAFIAQKECNEHNDQDNSKTQIVLMIAHIGGSNTDDRASSAKFVANQIADQTSKDPTIVAIMGWSTSTDSINMNHELKIRRSHLPMVSPSSSSDELQGMSNFFHVCPPNKEQAQMAANFLLKMKQKKRIVILYDQTTSYSNNLKDDFAKDIANNIVGSTPFTGGDSKTLQGALTNVLAQKPDAIFFAGQTNDLVELLKDTSSTAQTNNLLIFGGDALATTNAYSNPLPDMHNVYFTAFASPNEWDNTNQKPPFFQEYKDHFSTLTAPTGLSSIDVAVMLAYDATLTLLDASQQVLSLKNTLNASDLIQALKQITVANPIQGITGRIAFKDNGDQQNKRILLEHIEGTSLKVDDSQGCFRVTDNCSS